MPFQAMNRTIEAAITQSDIPQTQAAISPALSPMLQPVSWEMPAAAAAEGFGVGRGSVGSLTRLGLGPGAAVRTSMLTGPPGCSG